MKYGGAMLTVENNAGVAGFLEPCPARYSIKFNIIAGVYPGARLGAAARIFCAHAFNGHLWPLYQFVLIHNQSKRNDCRRRMRCMLGPAPARGPLNNGPIIGRPYKPAIGPWSFVQYLS
jgi:hypothetical protein